MVDRAVTVPVGQSFLNDPVDRDLRWQGAAAQIRIERHFHGLARQLLMLHC